MWWISCKLLSAEWNQKTEERRICSLPDWVSWTLVLSGPLTKIYTISSPGSQAFELELELHNQLSQASTFMIHELIPYIFNYIYYILLVLVLCRTLTNRKEQVLTKRD